MNHSLSYSSSCISEFFDAREYGTDPDDADSDEDSEEEGETGASDSEDDSEDDQVRKSFHWQLAPCLHSVRHRNHLNLDIRGGQLFLPFWWQDGPR